MRELVLIGIGTGNPDHLTRAGEKAIASADTILIPNKGPDKADLADLREDICASVIGENDPRIIAFDLPVRKAEGDYLANVEAWHDAIAAAWIRAVPDKAGTVALLVWGDPSLYDSTLRIAERLTPEPKVRVIPGITALQALTAAHAIPLNQLGAPVMITTGRRLRDEGWPQGVDTIAVMLDGQCSFQTLPPEDLTIWWGAYLGMPNQVLVSGALADVTDHILDCRTKARAAHGWIMDIYLLRRTSA